MPAIIENIPVEYAERLVAALKRRLAEYFAGEGVRTTTQLETAVDRSVSKECRRYIDESPSANPRPNADPNSDAARIFAVYCEGAARAVAAAAKEHVSGVVLDVSSIDHGSVDLAAMVTVQDQNNRSRSLPAVFFTSSVKTGDIFDKAEGAVVAVVHAPDRAG